MTPSTWQHYRSQFATLTTCDPAGPLAPNTLWTGTAVQETFVLQGVDGASFGMAATFGSRGADDAILDAIGSLCRPATQTLLRQLFQAVPHAPRFFEHSVGPDGRLVAGVDGVDGMTLHAIVGNQAPAHGANFRGGVHIDAHGQQMLFGDGRTESVVGSPAYLYTRSWLADGADITDALHRKNLQTEPECLRAASALFGGRGPSLLIRDDRPGRGLLAWTCT